MDIYICDVCVIMLLQGFLRQYCTALALNNTESKFVLSMLDPVVYDKRERPFKAQNKPVEVEIDVYFNTIADINEISMDLSIGIYLRLMWFDPRLNFNNNTDFTGIITLHESLRHFIWIPDVYFRNEKNNGHLHELTLPNIMITLSPNGYVLFSQRVSTKITCIMLLQKFPMDSQNCSLQIESYTHSDAEVILKWKSDSINRRNTIELPEYNISKITLGDCTTTYRVGNTNGTWSCIYVQLHLDRLFHYYVIQVYGPTSMVVVSSWVSFWIDIHAVSARIALGLITVLAITTQSHGVSSKLPRVSYIKGIDIWMFICSIFVFAALIEYSAVNVLARQEEAASKKEDKCKDVNKCTDHLIEWDGVGGNIAFLKAAKQLPQDEKEKEKRQHFLFRCCQKTKMNKALRVDILSRFIFPVLFLLFTVLYWSYYLNKYP